MHGDTCGVDLYVSGICEICALAVAGHRSRTVAAHGVCRKEVSISVTAGGDNHGVCGEPLELTGHEVLGDDSACAFHTVLVLDHHQLMHLVAVEALHLAGLDLAVERRVCAEQELLAGLSFCIESTAHLGAAEGTVGKETAVFTGEGNALCHTLVDDIVGDFGKTVHIGLAGTVVTTLHRVVEETIHGVAVVLIVLGCVDTSLGRDRMGAARAVLNAEV